MKIKMSIFVRILISTLLPVFLVLVVIIGTARNIIYMDGFYYANEFVRLSTEQVSRQTAVKLENTAILQNEIILEIINIDFDKPEAKQNADKLLEIFLLSNHDLYSTWFVFEPDTFSGNEYYNKMITRTDNGIKQTEAMNDTQLKNPEAVPWYSFPCNEGKIYADINYCYDLTDKKEPLNVLVMSRPIIANSGQIIGCLGLAIRYEDIFFINEQIGSKTQKFMMVSMEGGVLYSNDGDYSEDSLWDYNFKNKNAVIQALSEKAVWQEEIDSHIFDEKSIICLYPVNIANSEQTIYLCRETPTSNLYKSFYSSMEIIVFAGIFGMALLVLCVLLSTRRISNHVRSISRGFNSIAGDNNTGITLENINIPTYQTNVIELDILQSSLTSMITKLQKLHELQIKAVETEVEKENLIALSIEKTKFFASLSHEIRTPMNAIQGISKILLYEGNLTPSQEKNIQSIKISSDTLLNIVNDIQDISKLEAGKMELTPENYNFKEFMDNINSITVQLVKNADIEFIFNYDSELPLCLYGDKNRLSQIMLNLLGNAVKFTEKGYVRLDIFISSDEGTIRFDVSDTGIGIKESELESVFETFKRSDITRNRNIEGTGLGLSITKNLVELMNGTITVSSVYNKGSIFSVTIPMVLGDEKMLHKQKENLTKHYCNSLKILIVDDDKTNLYVCSGLIKAIYGIYCDTVLSGEEAIEKVMEYDYDIIFMDHLMPIMDGIETTKKIRKLGGRYKDIPIIALTANASSDVQQFIRSGLNGFLSKPIQIDKLHEILNIWIPAGNHLPEGNQIPAGNQFPANQPQHLQEQKDITLSDSILNGMLENQGINTLMGMENIGFDEKMYLHSLKIYINNIPNMVQKLENMLERKDIQAFFIRIHAMKSSLLSIGIAELSAEAKKIETIASDNNSNKNISEIVELFAMLAAKLNRLHENLKDVLPAEKESVLIPFDEKQMNENLKRLCSALDSYDYESITSELEIVLSMECYDEKSDLVKQIKHFINNYDYTAAAELIKKEL